VTLPGAIEEALCRALAGRGLGTSVERISRVEGGCINHGARIETDAGIELFLKWNAAAPAGMFDAEADGLAALRGAADEAGPRDASSARAVCVPAPLAWHSASDGASWLLLEYVAPGRASRGVEERLGRGLAGLHASTSGSARSPLSATASFGWHRDNWIGSLAQPNTPTATWADFWRDRRLAPQLEGARRHGHFGGGTTGAVLDRVLDEVPLALADVEHPELIHGDLWSGNWFGSAGGEPVLIDPAVYRGHGEVDLAMSELFGGFGDAFYGAYREAHGISEAYDAYRRDLYQLYYLLVHVNLFGASYEAGALRAAQRVVAGLGG